MRQILSKLYSQTQVVSLLTRNNLRYTQSALVPLHRYCSNEKPPTYRDLKRKEYQWKKPITWRSLAITSVFGIIGLCYMFYVKALKEADMEKERKKILGKAKIGGSFDLIDQHGKQVSSEQLKGQWMLVYFGFTHCPDICPDELEKMAAVIDKIDGNKDTPNIQPVFITVDPARDTKEAIKAYVAEFHPKFIGLTGSVEKIAEACKSYRVYFSAGPEDEDKDYIVDHTVIMYLINPDNNFVDYYGQNRNAEEITNSIVINMKKFELAK